MKCTYCASELSPGETLCKNCGNKAEEHLHCYTCPWCNHTSEGVDLSCPACGSPIDVKKVVNKSGWIELPLIKSMARIIFGNSSCQIEGTYVPIADVKLAEEDSIYFAHHILLWKDLDVRITTMPLKGSWKRMLAGMPLIMTQASGTGHIAFSRDEPGELIALPLQQNQCVDVREHIFMIATGNINYDWFSSNIWFTTGSGDDSETHYPLGMFLDRFTSSDKPGFLLLHGAGNVFVRTLAPGENILVKPTAFLYKDSTVNMHLHIERPHGTNQSWLSRGERYLWLNLTGPGRVAVQSAFDYFHDSGNQMVSSSPSTYKQW